MIISDLLLNWYRKNKRNLPWRKTKDAYFIWLSEIILQQTRVDQGINYYYKFIQNYPTITDLAESNEEDVLLNWQGLGYYSRARNLHKAAKIILKKHDGIFPNTYTDILELPGIGPYTAAAIASIAFNEAVPAVDGNVIRLITRLYDINKPVDSAKTINEIRTVAQELMIEKEAGDFNQAMIEFGALHCKPVNPDCEACVLKSFCLAMANKTVSSIPFKAKKLKIKKRFLNYFVVSSKHFELLIKKRKAGDVYQNLYDFPCYESKTPLKEHELTIGIKNTFPKINTYKITEQSKTYIHKLSHQTLHTTFWKIEIEDTDHEEYLALDKFEKLHNYPTPKLIDNYCNEALPRYKQHKNK